MGRNERATHVTNNNSLSLAGVQTRRICLLSTRKERGARSEEDGDALQGEIDSSPTLTSALEVEHDSARPTNSIGLERARAQSKMVMNKGRTKYILSVQM